MIPMERCGSLSRSLVNDSKRVLFDRGPGGKTFFIGCQQYNHQSLQNAEIKIVVRTTDVLIKRTRV